MTKQFDIAVIGGGLMARAFIKAMAKSRRIAVIEAKAPSLNTKRTFALNPATQRFFQTLKAWPPIATPITRIHVSQQGHFGKARFSATEFGIDALGYCVAERDLYTALGDDDATWYCPNTCTEIKEEDGYRVILNDGNEIKADLIIAADGANSFVRKALDLKSTQTDYQQTGIIANFLANHHQNTAYERFTAHGPLAVLPIADGWVNSVYCVQDNVEELMALSDEEYKALLQQEFGYRLGRIRDISQRVQFPLSLVESETVIAKRCAFIGNAAQTLHPVAGQGLNLGIRDVAILAEVLQTSEDIDSALQRYQAWRHQHQQNIIRLTDTLAKWFIPQSLLLPLLRGLSLQTLNHIGPFKRLFADITMGKTSLPSLMCGIEVV